MSKKSLELDKPWSKQIPFALGVVTDGPLLYTAGITARNPDGQLVGAGDMRAQMAQCLQNIDDILTEGGATLSDVIKWTMYTTDIDEFVKHSDVWRPYFVDMPASTLVEVSRLQLPEMMVELEAVARVSNPASRGA